MFLQEFLSVWGTHGEVQQGVSSEGGEFPCTSARRTIVGFSFQALCFGFSAALNGLIHLFLRAHGLEILCTVVLLVAHRFQRDFWEICALRRSNFCPLRQRKNLQILQTAPPGK